MENKLVSDNERASEILSDVFITTFGSKRNLGRILNVEIAKCENNPDFLNKQFDEVLPFVPAAGTIWKKT